FGVGSANDGACFDNVSVAVSDCPTATLATITIPKGLQVPAGSRLTVPVIVSTQKNIGLAQFTIEYNDTVLEFDQATIGTDAPGFAVSQLRRNPPFAPTTPGTNNNFIVQISGGGTNSFSGNDKVVVLLDFNATGNVGDTTPLAIDTDCSHTFLTTTDFDDICGDQITVNNGEATIIPTSEISGHVLYYFDSSPVINSSLKLTGATQFTQITDANGFYQFSNIAPDNYTLTPSKNDDHRAAIKGSDALLLMRYLAFLDTLSNEQLTAADVTQSGTITGSDVVALLRFLAFFTSNIAETGDWIFVPPSVSVNIPPSSTQDFQAFLLGDITGDWGVTMATNQLAKLNKSEGTLILERVSVAGSPDVRVPVFLQSSHHSIHSLLFSIAFDTSQVHLKAVESNAVLKDYMIVVNDTEPGKLHIAAVGLQPIPSHQAILNLAFEVQNKQIGAHERGFIPITFSRALLNDKNVAWVDGGIELTSATAKIPDRFELLQNYPNPFNLATTIRFGVPQVPLGMTHIILDIYNVNGQKVKRLVDEEKPPGYYSIQWDGRDNNGRVVSTGIYFYTFRAEKVQFSQKLLLIK
ncbi:MAG: cohesin domain-containing protein, partial [bacterium]